MYTRFPERNYLLTVNAPYFLFPFHFLPAIVCTVGRPIPRETTGWGKGQKVAEQKNLSCYNGLVSSFNSEENASLTFTIILLTMKICQGWGYNSVGRELVQEPEFWPPPLHKTGYSGHAMIPALEVEIRMYILIVYTQLHSKFKASLGYESPGF